MATTMTSSRVPLMLSNQKRLPRLPLPALEDTIARYLLAAKPLVPASQFEATKKLAQAELEDGSTLCRLQVELEELDDARAEPSFIAKAWEAMYLEGRWACPINSNPAWVSYEKVFADAPTQVERAARCVASAAAFAYKVETSTLAPDLFKGKVPLDMRQYAQMFASTRIPCRGRDVAHKAQMEAPVPEPVRHIVVLRREHFWRVPVRDASGRPHSVEALEAALYDVCENSDRLSAQADGASRVSLAALTTTDRDTWADSREALVQHSPTNARSLRTLDDALFCLCLDACEVGDDLDRAVRVALCGDCTDSPRWHDKSLTMAVTADGVPMGQFEHSWGDGVAVLRMGQEMYDAIKVGEYAGGLARRRDEPPATPTLLEWHVPSAIEEAKQRAAAAYEQTCGALQLSTLVFGRWGAAQLKLWKVSPDGALQAALQLAFFRTRGAVPSTYEAASTAHFAAGRTETIRSATLESSAFVQAVVRGAPVAEQAALLRASAARHGALARAAAEGQGFDRHLFALKARAPADTPFFADPTYGTVASNELSTSVLTLEYTRQSAFGPVHPTGFGVAYHVPPASLHFAVTAYAPQSAERFRDELETALECIGALLAQPLASL